ncbi:hypothetical protein KSF78_0004855 [Schistosoma japonicum]|nr:hypothetical protein KSF78_0004855 [Schistosoma japonicum]
MNEQVNVEEPELISYDTNKERWAQLRTTINANATIFVLKKETFSALVNVSSDALRLCKHNMRCKRIKVSATLVTLVCFMHSNEENSGYD